MDRQAAPGTLFVIEPDLGQVPPADAAGAAGAAVAALEVHTLDPAAVLRYGRALGASLEWVRVVGCQPEDLGAEDDEVQVGLSPAVAEAVGPAAALALELAVQRLAEVQALAGRPPAAGGADA